MMWRVGLSVFLFTVMIHVALGGELPPPIPRRDRAVADELTFRAIHQHHNNLVIETTNPNGNKLGNLGDIIVYNNGGSYKMCINTSSGAGTTWRCDASALTAP